MQTRCGIFASWQFGQFDSDFGLRKSCARRLCVRALEWRRLGFGIVKLL